MTDRNEATKRIKQALKKRTGRTWSVTGGRGTAFGWITIEAAKARRVKHDSNPKYDRFGNGEFSPVGAEKELAYIERQPGTGETAYYTSNEDREILAEALGIGMNLSHFQGVSISPEERDFFVDRAENGPPETELEPVWSDEDEPSIEVVDPMENLTRILLETRSPGEALNILIAGGLEAIEAMAILTKVMS